MKHLLLIILTVTLFSCGNKKQEIVEQIKVYKDSLTVVAKQELDLTIAISEVQSKYIGQQALDSVYALEMKQAPARAVIQVKKLNFKSKIDSLGLELKKY